MDEKLKKTLTYVLAGFGGFIVLLFLISSCTKKTFDYEDLVEKMVKVTKNYYAKEENKSKLPSQDKDTQSYTLKKMISDGEIDELDKLFKKENVKCDGNVTVINNDGNYLYTPYLNCGEDYTTVYLKDKLIENSLTEQGFGLYDMNGNHVFRGEIKNNYVSFNDQTYRIIRINEDGSIRLIGTKYTKNVRWDDRYNEDYHSSYGINEYELNSIDSRLKEKLKDLYESEANWPKESKAYVITQDLCIGKRSLEDITKDGSTECSKKIANQRLGVLAVYEYLQASLDTSCSDTKNYTCNNYNWLANPESSIWLLTPSSEDTRHVYKLDNSIDVSNCSSNGSILQVFNITDKAIYVSGDGTVENPYIFR